MTRCDYLNNLAQQVLWVEVECVQRWVVSGYPSGYSLFFFKESSVERPLISYSIFHILDFLLLFSSGPAESGWSGDIYSHCLSYHPKASRFRRSSAVQNCTSFVLFWFLTGFSSLPLLVQVSLFCSLFILNQKVKKPFRLSPSPFQVITKSIVLRFLLSLPQKSWLLFPAFAH